MVPSGPNTYVVAGTTRLSLGSAAGATDRAVPVGTAVGGIVSVTAPLRTAETVGALAPAGGVLIGTRTESVVRPTTPSTDALIVTGPDATPTTAPAATVATEGSELLQVVVRPLTVDPVVLTAVAVSVTLPPTKSAPSAGVPPTVTEPTTTGATGAVGASLPPPEQLIISAIPSAANNNRRNDRRVAEGTVAPQWNTWQ